jgi:hypothetical protein
LAYIQAFAWSYIFLKAGKIALFGPTLIHQQWLLGSQQHLQRGVLLTSFSTWGTQNSLAEINVGEKLADTCSFVGGQVSSVKQNVHTTFFPNPLSESKEVQSWGCSKILLSFLM